jgi:hypothetical protein
MAVVSPNVVGVVRVVVPEDLFVGRTEVVTDPTLLRSH